MAGNLSFSEREIRDLISTWTYKGELRSRSDVQPYAQGLAQGYYDAGGVLLNRLEAKEKALEQKVFLLKHELHLRNLWAKAIIGLATPLVLLLVVMVAQTNIRLIVPLVLAVVLFRLIVMRWSYKRENRMILLLVSAGLLAYLLLNWGAGIWTKVKADIGPEIAGMGLVAIVALVARRRKMEEEEKLALFVSSIIVLLGTLFAVDAPGLSLLTIFRAFVSSLSVELVGAGLAILMLMDELTSDIAEVPGSG